MVIKHQEYTDAKDAGIQGKTRAPQSLLEKYADNEDALKELDEAFNYGKQLMTKAATNRKRYAIKQSRKRKKKGK